MSGFSLSETPGNLSIPGIRYMAVWHLEKQNYSLAKEYFLYLHKSLPDDLQISLALSICYCMDNNIVESHEILSRTISTTKNANADPRIYFCQGLLFSPFFIL